MRLQTVGQQTLLRLYARETVAGRPDAAPVLFDDGTRSFPPWPRFAWSAFAEADEIAGPVRRISVFLLCCFS